MTTRLISTALIIASITAAVTLTGCRRAEDEPVQARPTEVLDRSASIPFPIENPVIGISVTAAPDGLVATFNSGNWLELTESHRPNVLYTFAANNDQEPRVEPPSIEECENDILGYDGGKITGHGTLDTALGKVNWAAGTFSEDGENLEKVYLLAPHPSGAKSLILISVCPYGAASVDERLVRIKELLQYVE